ncbi:hypothetical protein COOONC_06061 [Cooperia oncophora]
MSTPTNLVLQNMMPSRSTTGFEGFLELDETDPKLLEQDFLIKGSQLLKLFRFCPCCGSKISDSVRFVSLTANGAAPIVHYICTACSPFEKRFEGQVKEDSHPSETPSTYTVRTDSGAVTEDTNTQRRAQKVANDVRCAPARVASHKHEVEEEIKLFSRKRVKQEDPESALSTDNSYETGAVSAPKCHQMSSAHDYGLDSSTVDGGAIGSSSIEAGVPAESLFTFCDIR